MKTEENWKQFKALLNGLDDEFHRKIDAQVAASSKAGNVSQVEWLEDPDPFGDNWRWLYETADPGSGVGAPVERHADSAYSEKQEDRSWGRAILALAASLVIGLFIGRAITPAPKDLVVLAASGTARLEVVRGDERELRLRVTSPFDGYLTAIALAPNQQPQVRPQLGGKDLLSPEGRDSDFATLPSGTERVIYVVTPTPAGESIRRFMGDSESRYSPEDHTELRNDLQRYLESKGYRKMAFGEAVIDK